MKRTVVRIVKSAALLGTGTALLWKHFAHPACERTPLGELRGNPLLKELLVPSTFHLRAVATLDAGFKTYIAEHNLAMLRSKYSRDLCGRINRVVDAGVPSNSAEEQEEVRAELHNIRERRNDTGHEEAPPEMDWEQFDADAKKIEQVLESLSLTTEAATVRELRHGGETLKRSVHKKFYFGFKGMAAAAIADAATMTLGIHLFVAAFGDDVPSPILRFLFGNRRA